MAYDKHTWTCDEPITVERLNHIEDGIANAGGGECGYECEDGMVTLTEESVTTTVEEGVAEAYGELSYSQLINRDTITVTFNGTEYQCEVTYDGDVRLYGALYDWDTEAWDWSEYPFAIGSHPGSADALNELVTQTAGTYTIKIEIEEEIVTTTPCFDKARGYSCGEEMGVLTEEKVITSLNGSRVKGLFSYGEHINADNIVVTFNGTEYECDRRNFIGDNNYIYGGEYGPGGTDFSTYPFIILSSKGSDDVIENVLYTETAGTYSVKIETMQEIVTTTPCFEKAVKSVSNVAYAHMTKAHDSDTGCTIYTLDITDDDVRSIINAGQQLVIVQSTIKGNEIYNPTFMSAIGATTPALRAEVGGVSATVMITVQDDDENERLLTLSVRSGTASPRYLRGELCGSTSPLTVALDKNISEATESSPVSSVTASVHDGIMGRLEQGAAVYLQEGGNDRKLLITSYYDGNGDMQDSTITVNIEETDGTLGITYSKPIMFFFDSDGRCYYPASAT